MVIPVHDINPLRRTPWVTYGLIAANVAVLLFTPGTLPGTASFAAVACRQQAFDDRFGAIPHELITGRPLRLVPTGREVATAQGPACVIARPGYSKSPPLSVLTAMFVHAGWLHLLGNMLFLLIFGNNIEDRFRKVPYLIFYLACGYVAAYGFAAMNPGSVQPLVGASGAIAGVLGAYIVLFPRARVRAARWPTLRTCSGSWPGRWSGWWCGRSVPGSGRHRCREGSARPWLSGAGRLSRGGR
jgi:membrane associated rhomboid family serine protease